MAISKKYSRRIVVDGVAYRWRIPPEPNYDQGASQGMLEVTIWSEEFPNCVLNLLGGARPDNMHRAVGEIVTPGRVAESIRNALANGWNPERNEFPIPMSLPPVPTEPHA